MSTATAPPATRPATTLPVAADLTCGPAGRTARTVLVGEPAGTAIDTLLGLHLASGQTDSVAAQLADVLCQATTLDRTRRQVADDLLDAMDLLEVGIDIPRADPADTLPATRWFDQAIRRWHDQPDTQPLHRAVGLTAAEWAAGASRPDDLAALAWSRHQAGAAAQAVTYPARSGPVTITPGQLDADARDAFLLGGCGALAAAMHQAHGWPIVGLWADSDYPFHVAVQAPDGQVVDIDGPADPDDWVEAYGGPADCEFVPLDPEETRWVCGEVPDGWAVYGIPGAEQVAHSFVQPVTNLWRTGRRGWIGS